MLDERLSLRWKVLNFNDDPENESIQTAFKDHFRDTRSFGNAIKDLSETLTGFLKTRDLLDIMNGTVPQRCC